MIELIVAIAIVGIGLGAALSLILTSGIQNRRTELRTIATNLAREGLEVIRSIRDSNWLASQPFDTGLGDQLSPDADGTFLYDPPTQAWALHFPPSLAVSEFPDGVSQLRLTGGVYRQGGLGTANTSFRRVFTSRAICDNPLTLLTIERTLSTNAACSGSDLKVGIDAAVRVQYEDRGQTYVLTVEEQLYNWKP